VRRQSPPTVNLIRVFLQSFVFFVAPFFLKWAWKWSWIKIKIKGEAKVKVKAKAKAKAKIKAKVKECIRTSPEGPQEVTKPFYRHLQTKYDEKKQKKLRAEARVKVKAKAKAQVKAKVRNKRGAP